MPKRSVVCGGKDGTREVGAKTLKLVTFCYEVARQKFATQYSRRYSEHTPNRVSRFTFTLVYYRSFMNYSFKEVQYEVAIFFP